MVGLRFIFVLLVCVDALKLQGTIKSIQPHVRQPQRVDTWEKANQVDRNGRVRMCSHDGCDEIDQIEWHVKQYQPSVVLEHLLWSMLYAVVFQAQLQYFFWSWPFLKWYHIKDTPEVNRLYEGDDVTRLTEAYNDRISSEEFIVLSTILIGLAVFCISLVHVPLSERGGGVMFARIMFVYSYLWQLESELCPITWWSLSPSIDFVQLTESASWDEIPHGFARPLPVFFVSNMHIAINAGILIVSIGAAAPAFRKMFLPILFPHIRPTKYACFLDLFNTLMKQPMIGSQFYMFVPLMCLIYGTKLSMLRFCNRIY